MKAVASRSLVFAVVPLLLAVMADLLMAVFYQGAQPEALRGHLLVVHGGVFLAVIVLAGLGAFAAFCIFRSSVPTSRKAALFGLFYAVASFFAVVMAFAAGGPIAVGAWLFFGAAAFASGSVLIRGGHGG
jgi:hypothetical protein